LDEGIDINPDNMKVEDLHTRAWQVVRDEIESPIEQTIKQYMNFLGTETSTEDLYKIVLAAAYGQVDKILVEQNAQAWGRIFINQKIVDLHDKKTQPGNRELLDFSIKHTLLNGGEVYVLDEDQMPPKESPAAAVLRY
jgi:hypothetical protein